MIRLLVSAVGALLILIASRQLRSVLTAMNDRKVIKNFIPAVLAGTWLGILLCQVAYKNTTVSTATVLLATTPLFAVPLLVRVPKVLQTVGQLVEFGSGGRKIVAAFAIRRC